MIISTLYFFDCDQIIIIQSFSILLLFASMNTAFSLPEEDERQPAQRYPDIYDLDSINYKSPTLPLHFDKKYLPKNLCEYELLNASMCLLLYNDSINRKDIMCSLQLSHFELCRKKRDIRILNSIKIWQTNHFTNLDKQNKGMYQMGLNRKKDRLEGELQRQPSTIKGINKSKELESQIKEIRWRLDYIKKLDEQSD